MCSLAHAGMAVLLKLLAQARSLQSVDLRHGGLRDWLRRLVALGDFLADLSPTGWADDGIAMLAAAVASDESYDALYRLLELATDLYDAGDTDPPTIARRTCHALPTELAALPTSPISRSIGGVEAIPWPRIIEAILAIIIFLTRAQTDAAHDA